MAECAGKPERSKTDALLAATPATLALEGHICHHLSVAGLRLVVILGFGLSRLCLLKQLHQSLIPENVDVVWIDFNRQRIEAI